MSLEKVHSEKQKLENFGCIETVLFVMERSGAAYRHLFQVMKNKNY